MRKEIENIYQKNKNRKLQEIEIINNDIVLKARANNLIKLYPKRISILLILIAIILIATFHASIKSLTLILFMYVLVLIFSIYFNTFTIKCKNNKMTIITNMQEISIKYTDLKNIFIDKKYERIFIKKRGFYKLIILYKTSNGNISNIELPIVFTNIDELKKFLNNFTLKQQKSKKNIENAAEYKLKRLLIKSCLFILIWILILITIILV